jgi:hypothetical protein
MTMTTYDEDHDALDALMAALHAKCPEGMTPTRWAIQKCLLRDWDGSGYPFTDKARGLKTAEQIDAALQ